MSSRSTLQRLLALDKTADDLEVGIHEAASILQIDLNEVGRVKSLPFGANHGRHDFVFRWILGHLGKVATARCSPLSWRLIRCLIAAATPKIVSAWLSSTKLLQRITEALAETNLGLDVAKVACAYAARSSQHVPNKDDDDSSQKKLSVSRKRKRGEDAADSTKIVGSSELGIFEELSSCVLELSRGSDADNRQYARTTSLFRGATESDLSGFLREWLIAASQNLSLEGATIGDERLQALHQSFGEIYAALSEHTPSLDPAIWTSSLAKSVSFPALVLWSQVHVKDHHGALLRFFRNDVLRPDRDAFMVSKSGSDGGAPRDAAQDHDACKAIVDGIHECIEASGKNATVLEFGEQALGLFMQSATSLVDSRSLIERRKQTQWLESLLLSLNVISVRSGEENSSKPAERLSRITRTLLEPLADSRLRISSQTLQALLREYVTIPPDGMDRGTYTGHLEVISMILNIDALAFSLDSKNTTAVTFQQFLEACMFRINHSVSDEVQTKLRIIMATLIAAQKQARTCKDFFRILLDAIERSSHYLNGVWSSREVVSSFSGLFGTSLGKDDVRPVLDRARQEIPSDETHLDASDSTARSQRGRYLIALKVLLNSLQDDELIDELREDFYGLLPLLDARFSSKDAGTALDEVVSEISVICSLNRLLMIDVEGDPQVLLDRQGNCRNYALSKSAFVQDAVEMDHQSKELLLYMLQVQELMAMPTARERGAMAAPGWLETATEKAPVLLSKAFVSRPAIWLNLEVHFQQRLFKNVLTSPFKTMQTVDCLYQLLRLIDRSGNRGDDEWTVLICSLARLPHLTPDQRTRLTALTHISSAAGLQLINETVRQEIEQNQTWESRPTSSNNMASTNRTLDAALSQEPGPDVLKVTTHFTTDLSAREYDAAQCHLTKLLGDLPGSRRLQLAHLLLDELDSKVQVAILQVLRSVVVQLEKPDEPHDMALEAGAEYASCRNIVLRIVRFLEQSSDLQMSRAALDILSVCVRDKKFMINQYNVENILCCAHRMVSWSSRLRTTKTASALYMEICGLVQLLLQFHRPSLGGRLHLVIPTLTQLLSCLFTPTTSGGGRGGARTVFRHPPWLHAAAEPLTAKHAVRYARLVTLLCNPARSTVSGHHHHHHHHHHRGGAARGETGGNRKSVGLVDELREARLHVGEFAGTLLHAFCRFLLHGSLVAVERGGGSGGGVRQALDPALHAVFDVLDMAAPGNERVRALGAAMSKAELALLRKEHGEWKRFGRWRGA